MLYGDFPALLVEDGGRPLVPLCALFKAQMGTRVELLMFRKLAG